MESPLGLPQVEVPVTKQKKKFKGLLESLDPQYK